MDELLGFGTNARAQRRKDAIEQGYQTALDFPLFAPLRLWVFALESISVHFHPFAAIVLLLLTAGVARGEDWPQFRGPTGMGLTTERGLPREWDAKGKNVVWKVGLPGVARAGQVRSESIQPDRVA